MGSFKDALSAGAMSTYKERGLSGIRSMSKEEKFDDVMGNVIDSALARRKSRGGTMADPRTQQYVNNTPNAPSAVKATLFGR
jgi:hypothetical protein